MRFWQAIGLPGDSLRMYNKYRRCFYGLSKELFEDSRSPGRKRAELYRDIALLLYSGLHFGLMWYAWTYTGFNLSLYDMRKYDLYAGYFIRHQEMYDPFVIVVIYLFELFDFACQVAFYRLPSQASPTWRWWHQITVVNQEAYYASLIGDSEVLEKIYQAKEKETRLWVQSNWRKVYCLLPEFVEKKSVQLLAHLSIWFHLEHVDKGKFFGTPFKVVPCVSNRVRRRILLFSLAFDGWFYLLQIGYVALYAVLIVSNFILEGALDLSQHPWYAMLWGCTSALLAYLALLRLIRSAIFFVGCSLLATIVYAGHVKEMGKAVEKLLNGLKRPRAPLHPASHLVLYRHLHEHNLICFLVIDGCRTLFGFVLVAFLLTHIPINVYLIGKNVFTSPPLVIQLTIWLVALFQGSSAAVVFLPLAWCCVVYHSPKKFIPRLQAALQGRGWLLYKLKYDDLYNRLTQGLKMAVFIGNMSTPITFSSALEFLFMYIGFLLMSFSQVIDANLEKATHRLISDA